MDLPLPVGNAALVSEKLAELPSASEPPSDFASFYEAHYPGAVRLAALLGAGDAAEDVVQNAFGKLGGRFRALTNPPAYLRQVVITEVRVMARTRGRRVWRERRASALSSSHVDDIDEMRELLRDLPYEQRAVLVLRYWLDAPDQEIADLLGCARSTVRSHARRALRTLRKELEDAD